VVEDTVRGVDTLADDIAPATDGFSGVVSVSRGETVEFERAYGLADRAHDIPVRTETRFGIASGTKCFTALTVAGLIADGALKPTTTARSLLGDDLPLIADDVTVEHLLAHTSGIGDYFDEDVETHIDDYLLQVPVHALDTIEGYVAALDGFPTKFAAGTRFSYSNGGYVVLSLLAERAGRRPFAELVEERVCRPAGMSRTEFLRSDRLPGDAAFGYLADGRTNVLHLPVRGGGDGGAYSTVADMRAFWLALFGGRILAPAQVAELVAPRSDVPTEKMRYGLGFWLHRTGPQVLSIGYDVGVSFRSVHDPTTSQTRTVVSNTADGAWPVSRRLDEVLD
jgi:CubicO group peptidase (beta-lactamase class C family)